MKKVVLMLSVLFVMTYASVLVAGAQVFDEIDNNKDGYISKNEASTNKDIQSNWTSVDTDKDGKVDLSEFSAFEAKGMFQPPDLEEPEPGAAPMD